MYTRELRSSDMKALKEMLNPQEFISAGVKQNQYVEYEPDQDLLYFTSKEDGKLFTFVFSDHGLVNIHKEPNKMLVELNSEYGCFEQSAACIEITKMYIGFMASKFMEDYVVREYHRRKDILKALKKAKIKGEHELDESEEDVELYSTMLDTMEENNTDNLKYMKNMTEFMNAQQKTGANHDYCEEIINLINYHTAIANHLYEIGRDIFKINLVDTKRPSKNKKLEKKDIIPARVMLIPGYEC